MSFNGNKIPVNKFRFPFLIITNKPEILIIWDQVKYIIVKVDSLKCVLTKINKSRNKCLRM